MGSTKSIIDINITKFSQRGSKLFNSFFTACNLVRTIMVAISANPSTLPFSLQNLFLCLLLQDEIADSQVGRQYLQEYVKCAGQALNECNIL